MANDLTPEQEAELLERQKLYESGQMEFSSWEDVKNRIINRKRTFTTLHVDNKDFKFDRDEANER